MSRALYLGLAARGARFPIGTDLVLHEQDDPEEILLDGARLGRVTALAAERYQAPLAIPLMDLRLEKADLLRMLGIPESECDSFHFQAAPEPEVLAKVDDRRNTAFSRRNQAHLDAIRWVARETPLVPVGMAIGPFSLMTKLMADPITPIAMAGTGATAEEDRGVLMAERCLGLAETAVARSLAAQVAAGARAVIVCEPAANAVYLSPRQIQAGSDIFDRFVLDPNLRLRRQLDCTQTDLIFHNCGDLTGTMVAQFAERLHPVALSLGGSRKLWEDAARVPKDVVLFGNLPTKSFYSDTAMPIGEVERLTLELLQKMKAAGHPHILGSECDVLHVPEAARTIREKLQVMLTCGGKRPPAGPQETERQ